MYTAEDLEELMRVIIRRGMQVEPEGIDHKHNETIPGSPRSPIKLHLCTPDLRPEARLTEDDMQKIVQMFWSYIEYHRLKVPAFGCIPRVGEKFAFMLQRHAYEQTGRYIPVVRAKKIQKEDGGREIGNIVPSGEYPSGDLWLVDDVVNWAHSHHEAFVRYTAAGYRVTDSLVVVDYRVGAEKVFSDFGVNNHSLLLLDSILLCGTQEKLMSGNIIAQTKEYLAASRAANAVGRPGQLFDKTV